MTDSAALAYPFPAPPEPGCLHPVAPGVAWARMPLPFALDHVNVWVLDDGPALAVVDTGYALPEVRTQWERILAADPRPLARVIVTHCHPDHLGLATWLAARDGGAVHMAQGEFLAGQALWHQLPGYAVADMVAQFRAHGLDEARLEALVHRGNGYRRGVPEMPARYRRLFDGERLATGANTWQVIVGHGHAPEHVSLYCEKAGLLISGDMLLPRISTNVSVFAATPDDDPLAAFLASLHCIKALPEETLVLPSHGRPFRGLRARIGQLEAHHQERCERLLAALDVPRSAGELLPTLFDRALDTHQVMFAMGEAIAHLNFLTNKGALRRRTDGEGKVRFERTA